MASEKCQAKTAAGKPCRAAPMAGGLCFLHANPDKVRSLGQVGGRRNRNRTSDFAMQPSEINAAKLSDIVAQAIVDVMSNTLAPRNAGAVAQLSNNFMKINQMTDLEQRVAKLEHAAREGVPVKGDAETGRATPDYVTEAESGEEGRSDG